MWNEDSRDGVTTIAMSPFSNRSTPSTIKETKSDRTPSNASASQMLEFAHARTTTNMSLSIADNAYTSRGTSLATIENTYTSRANSLITTGLSTPPTSHTLQPSEEAASYSPSQVASSPPTSGLGNSTGVDAVSELMEMRIPGGGGGPLHSSSAISTGYTYSVSAAGSYDPSQVGGIWF